MIGSDVPAQRARRPRGSKLFKTPAGTGRLPSCQHPPVPLHLGHSSPPRPHALLAHSSPSPLRQAEEQTARPWALLDWCCGVHGGGGLLVPGKMLFLGTWGGGTC